MLENHLSIVERARELLWRSIEWEWCWCNEASKKYYVGLNSILMESKTDSMTDIQVGSLLSDIVIIKTSTKRDLNTLTNNTNKSYNNIPQEEQVACERNHTCNNCKINYFLTIIDMQKFETSSYCKLITLFALGNDENLDGLCYCINNMNNSHIWVINSSRCLAPMRVIHLLFKSNNPFPSRSWWDLSLNHNMCCLGDNVLWSEFHPRNKS